MYTKIRIEEILYGFSHSVTSVINVSTLHQSGFQNVTKSPPQFSIPQSIENWSSFESGKIKTFKHKLFY